MLNLLIKPASDLCNMRCEYCFYHDESERREVAFKGIMSCETAENLVRKAFQKESRRVLFAFQGGEPTLAGLEFFESFTELVGKYNTRGAAVEYTLQTNGLLIDEKWARFLARNAFLVGLSCDGAQKYHDRFRKDAAGNDTFDRVIRAADIMKKYGVDYNALIVVTAQSARNIKKIYTSLKKCGFKYMQFIPCLDPLDVDRILPQTLCNDDYLYFLETLFKLWFDDFKKGEYYSIRYFDNLFFMYNGDGAEQCGMQGHCNIQFVVEGNGDVYPCDFYCLDEYILGNINRDGFDELARSSAAKAFIGNSAGFDPDCKLCECFDLCRSGCRRYKRDGKYIFCDAFKRFSVTLRKTLPEINRILRSDLYNKQ